MKSHINKLYSLYPEQITKLERLSAAAGISKSAMIRQLIDAEFTARRSELGPAQESPPEAPNLNSDAS